MFSSHVNQFGTELFCCVGAQSNVKPPVTKSNVLLSDI